MSTATVESGTEVDARHLKEWDRVTDIVNNNHWPPPAHDDATVLEDMLGEFITEKDLIVEFAEFLEKRSQPAFFLWTQDTRTGVWSTQPEPAWPEGRYYIKPRLDHRPGKSVVLYETFHFHGTSPVASSPDLEVAKGSIAGGQPSHGRGAPRQ